MCIDLILFLFTEEHNVYLVCDFVYGSYSVPCCTAVGRIMQIATEVNLNLYLNGLSLWLIGTVRAVPETVISRAWVQSPDPAE